MAKQTIYTDDLDGSHGAQPVRFGFRDKQYEIDLSQEHEEEMEAFLARYIEKGREAVPPPPAPGRARGAGKRPGRTDLPAIREWAQRKGMEVADRGRIKADIIEEYDRERGA